ncbi:MAG TPA: hypothetical protein VLC46_07825 [Thermoanaerobaculia bacterium]|jgi:hypothetical protein|nr:hypothetical protein [Thermoanaerobaculia bacterium]
MNRQHIEKRVIWVIVVAFLGLAASDARAQLYVGNDQPSGGVLQFTLPISASSTPNFKIGASSVIALGFDAKGDLAVGALGGGLTFFPAPLSGSSTPSATFTNGVSSNVGAIAFTAAGDFFATSFGNSVNLFTHPFSNASTPSLAITNANLNSAAGLAVDAAQNLYVANTGGSGANTFGDILVYAPPYTGTPIITGPAIGANYRKMVMSGTQLFVTSVASPGRIDVYTLPITGSNLPAFSITSGTNLPEAVALDAVGNLHVGNLGSSTITVYSPPFSASSTPAITLTPGPAPFSIFSLAIGPSQSAILPAVGSATGSGGSFFRTGVQLQNPSASAISGSIVFHTAGVSGVTSDPFLSYTLNPGQTQTIDDLLPALARSGIGSADVVSTSGSLPTVVARVFNDGGDKGTSGFTEDLMKPQNALSAGDQFVLLVPADLARFRYNIGVRTLGAGASITVTQRNSGGTVVRTVSKTYAPTYFEQVDATTFLGAAPSANDSLTVSVASGALFIYGATTDNTTQDPSVQLGRK